MVTSLRGGSRIPYVTTMLSTANVTHAQPLTHTRTLGSFVVAATIGQVGTPGGVPKTRCLVYQTNIESHTQLRTRPTAHCDQRSEVTVIGPLTVGGRGSSDKSRSLSGQDLHSSRSATPAAHTQFFSDRHRAGAPCALQRPILHRVTHRTLSLLPRWRRERFAPSPLPLPM